MSDVDLSEALRLIRKHMQPGDTIGKMFMRVAKALEAEQFTQSGDVCDGCGKVLICRNCGKFRSGDQGLENRSYTALQWLYEHFVTMEEKWKALGVSSTDRIDTVQWAAGQIKDAITLVERDRP